jgi:rod shape determining protein RodA
MRVIQSFRHSIGDVPLLFVGLAMGAFGVAMVYSAGQLDVPSRIVAGLWRMQLVWLAIALGAFLLVTRIQARWYEWVAIPAYVVAVLLLVLTLAIGGGQGTAASQKSWIFVGPVAIQTAQFASIATILMLARMMGSWREPPATVWALWKPIAIVGVPLLLIMAQPDLGTGMVQIAILLAAMYWAGVPLGLLFMLLSPALALFLAFQGWMFSVYMLLLIAFLYLYRARLSEWIAVLGANLAAGAIAVPLWNSLAPYQQARLLVFIDPSIDPRGSGWHVIQSKVAIGSGGLFGKGWTLGTQKRLAFLPEQHTDFIFSVVGEELGFLFGAVPVLLAFAFILWRLARISERVTDPFAGIVVFGIFGAWFAHVLVNIGMTAGVMPIAGIPLPFLSYGGSFLLATFIALGMAERIAAEHGRT